MDENVRLKISSPWVTYVNKLNALFGSDPDIKFEYDNDLVEVKLFVNNPVKYEAIRRIVPIGKRFGNVCLGITVVPANGTVKIFNGRTPTKEELFDSAFSGNPVYEYSKTVAGIFSNTITYVVFKHCVVQFFNDNLNDIYGNITTLYEDIAREIFADEVGEGVFYCTEVAEGMVTPNWP